MAFSSNFFIFGFLPIVFALYVASPLPVRNLTLLVASLAFYAFDAGWLVWLLLASIVVNHVAARSLAHSQGRRRHAIFVCALALNLLALLHFKYTAFLWSAGASLLEPLGLAIAPPPHIELPIGISFFTFQAISYLADVYTRHVPPAKSIIDFGMYHSLFPQLIAGPIVRYAEIQAEVFRRILTVPQIAEGICRFCFGLGKKLIIADTMGGVADRVFSLPFSELTWSTAWLGISCYTLQIYFDFSGYSDMAIGLGRMLGFHFPENFDQPYRSRSITEFWRRWHMTLSRWFRDYVYIPLGGNRDGRWRTYRNLVIVFFLCGLWHGAAYTFIIWGLYHGLLLICERLFGERPEKLAAGRLRWAITLLLIMIGWVFFRSATVPDALNYMAVLFGLVRHPGAIWANTYLTGEVVMVFVVGWFLALAPLPAISLRLQRFIEVSLWKSLAALTVFAYAIVLLSFRSFNPFIYFRF